MLLIDELFSPGVNGLPGLRNMGSRFWQVLPSVEVFEVSNVAEYLWTGTQQEVWNIEKDVPNMAPPFTETWMEYRFPHTSRSGSLRIDIPPFFERVGVLCVSRACEQGWIINALVCVKPGAAIDMPRVVFWGMVPLRIDPDGSPHYIRQPNGMPTILGSNTVPDDAIRQTIFILVAVAGLGLSFVHCRNVEIIERIAPPKVQEKRRKNGKRPLVRYHVLKINAIKKVLERDGQAATAGVKHALHVCRGHFKDYRKGKGLFGQHGGMYWWHDHLRGHAEAGIVVKDYAVSTAGGERE